MSGSLMLQPLYPGEKVTGSYGIGGLGWCQIIWMQWQRAKFLSLSGIKHYII
jgi:hypothetical protein